MQSTRSTLQTIQLPIAVVLRQTNVRVRRAQEAVMYAGFTPCAKSPYRTFPNTVGLILLRRSNIIASVIPFAIYMIHEDVYNHNLYDDNGIVRKRLPRGKRKPLLIKLVLSRLT
jgi:hypothetical protein